MLGGACWIIIVATIQYLRKYQEIIKSTPLYDFLDFIDSLSLFIFGERGITDPFLSISKYGMATCMDPEPKEAYSIILHSLHTFFS